MKKTTEYCPNCESEVRISATMFVTQKCPKCGHPIKACSLCDWDVCNCIKCRAKYAEVTQ